MGIEELINGRYQSFSENERYVCAYLLGHKRECCRASIGAFARECGVSQALLVRFAKKLGFSGYGELKARLRLEEERGQKEGGSLIPLVTDGYHRMMDGLMERDLSRLFERLKGAKRVFLYASGSAQARAASEMKRIFLPVKSMLHVHGHDLAGALGSTAGREDLVFLISMSGESESVVALAASLRAAGVPSVSITRQCSNSLAELCSENLYIDSMGLRVEGVGKYETPTPYFILIEFLYLSYLSYLERQGDSCKSAS